MAISYVLQRREAVHECNIREWLMTYGYEVGATPTCAQDFSNSRL